MRDFEETGFYIDDPDEKIERNKKGGDKCYDYDLSDLILEQSEKRDSKGEYLCTCPICKAEKDLEEKYEISGYNKRKLYIDPSMSIGFCQRCKTTFIDKTGISRMKVNNSWKNIQIAEPQFISIPYNREPKFDESASKYLLSRCPSLYSKIDLNQFGIIPTYRKLIIKFDLNGSNFYYQIRYQFPDEDNDGQRYYSPVTGEYGKPLYFALGKFNPAYPTILVEGVFTAITEKLIIGKEVNVIAILGHYVTNFQLRMLQNIGLMNDLFIHMDETELSFNIKKDLRHKYPNAKVIPNLNFKNNENKIMDSEELIRYNAISAYEYHNYLIDKMDTEKLIIK